MGVSQRRAHQATDMAQQPNARTPAAPLGAARNFQRTEHCTGQHLIVDAVKVGLPNAYGHLSPGDDHVHRVQKLVAPGRFSELLEPSVLICSHGKGLLFHQRSTLQTRLRWTFFSKSLGQEERLQVAEQVKSPG
jgi:hypothetical protein